jgi:acyl-CoA synthetase (NDP forming)
MPLLSFKETEKLLLKYKIPFLKGILCRQLKDALKNYKKLEPPLVLKVSSPFILHRTELKGVVLGIKNKKELKDAFNKILKSIKRVPNLKIEGMILQREIKGIEVSLGMKRDPVFGPTIMFGSGGIFLELLRDVSFGICPLNKREANQMIKETKIYKILSGYRNIKRVDIEKIVDILLNLSKLALKEKNIKEIDLNPVICNEKEILACDFKIII